MIVRLQDNQCKAQKKVSMMLIEISLEKDVFAFHSAFLIAHFHFFDSIVRII